MREYAAAYSKILNARNFHHVYIDAFAGAGIHRLKISKEFVRGSPLNALLIDPPFKEFFFIDLDSEKADLLRRLVGGRKNVHIYAGDCNELLLREVFPQVRYKEYRRGLCLLDPYGLHLNWNVVLEAGRSGTIDMFLNFQVMDMNRNYVWRSFERVSSTRLGRMNAVWGDNSWREIAYKTQETLFGPEQVKEESRLIVDAYCQRLKRVAGFKYVARPLPMKNTKGAIVYYLLFSSRKQVAEEIVDDIFQKYENHGLI